MSLYFSNHDCAFVAGLARMNCKTRCGSKWVRLLAALPRKERNQMRSLSRRCKYHNLLSFIMSLESRVRWAEICNLGDIVSDKYLLLALHIYHKMRLSMKKDGLELLLFNSIYRKKNYDYYKKFLYKNNKFFLFIFLHLLPKLFYYFNLTSEIIIHRSFYLGEMGVWNIKWGVWF